MFGILRIVFCILACICVVAATFVGVYFDLFYALLCIGAALVFFVLMLLVKDGNPFHREKKAPRKTDFMNSDEENEAIRAAEEKKEPADEPRA